MIATFPYVELENMTNPFLLFKLATRVEMMRYTEKKNSKQNQRW